MEIVKRNGSIENFTEAKITHALEKAFTETQEADVITAAQTVTSRVLEKLPDAQVTVEDVQDLVEQSLMELGYFMTAKAYIIYRSERKKARTRDIFKKRTNMKPYEYPELYQYVTAIRSSFWVHTEFNYTSDVQDFHVNVSSSEREVVRRTMLAISQIEVAVKSFWGDIYKKLPKPEIGGVGSTFAENEVRHMDAYSHLLEILGLNEDFENVQNIPVLQQRVEYLEKVIELAKADNDKDYALAIMLFSLFIEHVSLFSQFLIMMSFNKHKNLFKAISNAVEATSKEENLHGMFGIDVINIIQEEHPEWFNEEMKARVNSMCLEALQAETAIVDWIFESGELDFIPKRVVIEFIKSRLNNSLQSINMAPVFAIDAGSLKETEWFDIETVATKQSDFFYKRSVNYNKRSTSITKDDLF